MHAHDLLASSLQETIDIFKQKANEIVGILKTIKIFTQKFCILDHVVEDVSLYKEITLLDALDFEQFSFVVKTYIRITSMEKGRTFEENVRFINFLQRS